MAAPAYAYTNFSGSFDPGGDILALVEAQLTIAGWQFVEENSFTQSATTRLNRTWRCPGTLNVHGVDFYLHLVKNSAAGTYFAVRMSEAWDAVGKTLLRPVISGATSFSPVAVTFTGGAGNWALTGATSPTMYDQGWTFTTSTQYDVLVLVSKSYIAFTIHPINSATITASFLGGYMIPGYADSVASFPPLFCFSGDAGNQGAASNATSGVSRSMRVTGATNAWGCAPSPEMLLLGALRSPAATTAKEIISGQLRAVRVAMLGYGMQGDLGAYNGVTAVYPGLRGYLYDAVMLGEQSSGRPNMGDTIVVGGVTYTRFFYFTAYGGLGAANGGIWFNAAAGS